MFDNPKFPSENKEFLGLVVDFKEDNGRILHKVRIPSLHYKNVKDEHLPYIPYEVGPGQSSLTQSFGALDKGQLVVVRKYSGQGATGFGSIVAGYQPVLPSDKSLPGNLSISNLWKYLEETEREIRLPPDLKKVLNENGVEVVEVVEKGLHKLSSLYGLSTHGAQGPLNGVKIPQMSQISTALDGATSVFTSSMMSGFPGTNFNLGQLFDVMSSDMKTELFKNMPKGVSEALNTVVGMVQGYNAQTFGGAIMGKRVELDTFLPNVVNELKDIKNVDSLLGSLNSLMTDPKFSGLSAFEMLIPTLFGNKILKMDSNGNFSMETPDEFNKILDMFKSALGGVKSSEGSLFDKVEALPNMMERMIPEVAQKLQQNMKDVPILKSYQDWAGGS